MWGDEGRLPVGRATKKGRRGRKGLRIPARLTILALIRKWRRHMMSEHIEIRVHVPSDLGLTADQIAILKEKVSVEIVASTLPSHGLTPQAPQRIAIQMVDDDLRV
jgi:hypothetical protein